jgi:hypothetical protein
LPSWGARPEPVGDREPARRPGAGSVATALAIVAIPALAIEGVRRWEIEPKVGRLAVGSEPVIDRRIGPIDRPDHAVVGLDSGRRDTLLSEFDGVMVQVESDREPVEIEANQARDRSLLYLDTRMVRVRLLEGPRAGHRIDLERCWLRPR